MIFNFVYLLNLSTHTENLIKIICQWFFRRNKLNSLEVPQQVVHKFPEESVLDQNNLIIS